MLPPGFTINKFLETELFVSGTRSLQCQQSVEARHKYYLISVPQKNCPFCEVFDMTGAIKTQFFVGQPVLIVKILSQLVHTLVLVDKHN